MRDLQKGLWSLGDAPSGVGAVGRRPRRLGPRRFVLRDRRRRAAAPVRPAGAAGRARGARGQPRDRGRAHQRLARTRRPRPRRALGAQVFVPPPDGTGLTLFDRWIAEGQTREQVLERLRPLLELPVEIVLPTRGAPTDRAALERALT